MGDKGSTADAYVEGSTSFPAQRDSSSDSSDDDKEQQNEEKEKPYKVTLESILLMVKLLGSKKRGEFPTTMDKEKRDAAIAADLEALRTSDLVLNERQYKAFALKVATAALNMPEVPTAVTDSEMSKYNATILDLKALFSLPMKAMKGLELVVVNHAKAEIAAVLFRLKAELKRPCTGVIDDMTQDELKVVKDEAAKKAAIEKKRTGTDILAASVSGESKKSTQKRAKKERGGSNDFEVQRDGVPFSPASATKTVTPSALPSISDLTSKANELMAALLSATPGAFPSNTFASSCTPDSSVVNHVGFQQMNAAVTCANCEARNGSTRINCWRCEVAL